MAKRAPENETAFNPLDGALIQAVIKGSGTVRETQSAERAGQTRDHVNTSGQASPIGQVRHWAEMGRTGVAPESEPERLSREKRVLLTQGEERQLERLAGRFAEALGTSTKLSHLLRAATSVLIHAEAELIKHAQAFGPLVRPANGDAPALARFEEDISRIVSEALRNAPPLR